MPLKNTSHRKWVLGFTLFLIFLTSLPTILAELSAGEDWVFTGFLFGVQDGNSYIAKMLRGFAGDWLFTTPYTAYPQSGIFAFFPYYLLGKLAAPPGLHDQLIAIFHWLRVGGIIFLVWSLDRFLRFFLGDDEGLIRWGLMLATLGGGLGWLYLAGAERLWGGDLPLELYSPESFGFLMLMGLPHLLFARGFLLISIQSILTTNKPSVQQGVKAGIGLMLVGLFQPLTTAAAWAVLAAFCVSVFGWTMMVKKHDLAVRKEVFTRRPGSADLFAGCALQYDSLCHRPSFEGLGKPEHHPFASVWRLFTGVWSLAAFCVGRGVDLAAADGRAMGKPIVSGGMAALFPSTGVRPAPVTATSARRNLDVPCGFIDAVFERPPALSAQSYAGFGWDRFPEHDNFLAWDCVYGNKSGADGVSVC